MGRWVGGWGRRTALGRTYDERAVGEEISSELVWAHCVFERPRPSYLEFNVEETVACCVFTVRCGVGGWVGGWVGGFGGLGGLCIDMNVSLCLCTVPFAVEVHFNHAAVLEAGAEGEVGECVSA